MWKEWRLIRPVFHAPTSWIDSPPGNIGVVRNGCTLLGTSDILILEGVTPTDDTSLNPFHDAVATPRIEASPWRMVVSADPHTSIRLVTGRKRSQPHRVEEFPAPSNRVTDNLRAILYEYSHRLAPARVNMPGGDNARQNSHYSCDDCSACNLVHRKPHDPRNEATAARSRASYLTRHRPGLHA